MHGANPACFRIEICFIIPVYKRKPGNTEPIQLGLGLYECLMPPLCQGLSALPGLLRAYHLPITVSRDGGEISIPLPGGRLWDTSSRTCFWIVWDSGSVSDPRSQKLEDRENPRLCLLSDFQFLSPEVMRCGPLSSQWSRHSVRCSSNEEVFSKSGLWSSLSLP